MRRTIDIATLLLACAALAPACLLESGSFETSTGGGGTIGPGGGGSGGTSSGTGGNTGGTGGMKADCANGTIESGEQCDDGNEGNDDGCSSTCQIEPGFSCVNEPSKCDPTCGHGTLNGGGEECDDGNVLIGDGCNQGCQVEDLWECENPKGSAFPSVCHLSCADGTLDDGETCDPGEGLTVEGCDAECHAIAGWTCIDAPSTCTTECGDGVIAGEEKCDDSDGGACTADCKAVNDGWDCDPMVGGPGSCKTTCGDGFAVGLEKCDDGNAADADGCKSDCTLEATCPNGIVEPGEECDDLIGCTACKLDNPVGACSQLISINALGTTAMEGTARATTFDGDSNMMPVLGFGNPTTHGTPPCAPPEKTINEIKVHRYTTGNVGSVVTIEALPKTAANENTFDETVVWVVLDCLDTTKIDACRDDGAPGGRAKLPVGYVPPQTTLYIAIADNGNDGESGKYSLKVTEQPVKLFFYKSFAEDIAPFTASDSGNDMAKWKHCKPGPGCLVPNRTFSRSGGGYAIASDSANKNLSLETMRSTLFMTGEVPKLFVQYDVDYDDRGGQNDEFKLEDSGDGTTWVPRAGIKGADSAGRRIDDVSGDAVNSMLGVGFYYDDAMAECDYAAVDDVYVYGF